MSQAGAKNEAFKTKSSKCLGRQQRCRAPLSSLRIRVEHAIGGVKRYRIVKDKIRNWKREFKDSVFETCCGLHNFRLKFRPWRYPPTQLHLFADF